MSDDPFYAPRRTIKETVEHLKATLQTMPKPPIKADWERLDGMPQVRHKPSGCVFGWVFQDRVWRDRQTRMMVVNLLECPSILTPHELQQITGWAHSIAAFEVSTTPPRLGGLWDASENGRGCPWE